MAYTYNVDVSGTEIVVEANDAIDACEVAIKEYNEEYIAAIDDWFLSGGEEGDELDKEVGEIPHISNARMEMIDADTQGHEWARFVGTNENGCWGIAIATLNEAAPEVTRAERSLKMSKVKFTLEDIAEMMIRNSDKAFISLDKRTMTYSVDVDRDGDLTSLYSGESFEVDVLIPESVRNSDDFDAAFAAWESKGIKDDVLKNAAEELMDSIQKSFTERHEKEVEFAIHCYSDMDDDELIEEIRDNGRWDAEMLEALAWRLDVDTKDCEDAQEIADKIEQEAGIDLY